MATIEPRANAPRFAISAIELYERPVVLRIPFRFGNASVSRAPQAFVRVRIELAGRASVGASAELMIPKWFDKSPDRSHEANVDDLRRSLACAAESYSAGARPLTAFGHSARHYRKLLDEGARRGLNPLSASYGGAVIDRALLDALCRARDINFVSALASNAMGLDARLTPDLAGCDLAAFLAARSPARSIAVRHTVGLADPIVRGDAAAAIDDGLPESLEDVIAAYGLRFFKLKLGGDVLADVERLQRIAAVLDRLPAYRVTLDGNEQYADHDAVLAFWHQARAAPRLDRLLEATLYLEQPIARGLALGHPVQALAAIKPLLIDESDASLDAFPAAAAMGYAGVSSKACKGIYKSLLNAARCQAWNAGDARARFFMSGEDLTTQAGLAVQQDLALVAALGLTHVERNGHHYVDGFAGQGAGPIERDAFLRAHPGLYHASRGNVRLTVRAGSLDLSSLACSGYASGAEPEWKTLEALHRPLTLPAEPIALA